MVMERIRKILKDFNKVCKNTYNDYPYGYCNIASRALKEILERESWNEFLILIYWWGRMTYLSYR